jgi:hypothetical protein
MDASSSFNSSTLADLSLSPIVADCSVFRMFIGTWGRCECSPVPKSQKIIDLALSPAVILGGERIDAGVDADVANK